MVRKLFCRKAKLHIFWEPAETADTVLYTPPEAAREFLLSLLVTMLFVVSAILCFCDVFRPESVNAWTAMVPVAAVLPMLFFFEVLYRLLPKHMEKLRFAVPVIYGLGLVLYFFLHRSEILSGTQGIGAQLIKAINYYYKLNLTVPADRYYGLQKTAFAFWLACILTVVLLQALWSRKRLVIGLLPLLVIALDLLVGYAPQMKGLAWGFAGLICANAGEWPEEDCAWAKEKRWGYDYGSRLIAMLAAIVLAVLIPLAGNLFFRETAERMASSETNWLTIQSELEDRLENFMSVFSSGSDGRIDNREPKYQNKEVMKLTVSGYQSSAVYLRGFSGAQYKAGSWTDGSRAFEEACVQAGYDPVDVITTQADNFIAGLWESGVEGVYRTCRLEYTDLSSRTLYVPYYVHLDELTDQYTFSGDYTLTKSSRNTSVSMAWSFPGDFDEAAWTAIYRSVEKTEESAWYNDYVREHYLEPSEAVPAAARIAEEIRTGAGTSSGTTVNVKWSFPEETRTSEGTDSVEFLSSEDKYLQNNARVMYAKMVQDYLGEGTYSWNLDRISGGTDCVEYFLDNDRKGYCIHFASAGTLILRELGVPARFASGYLVKPGSYSYNGTDYETSIQDNQAHAWVEIYLDDIGWVPVEMTPGNFDSTGGTGASSGYEPDETGEGEDDPEDPQREPDKVLNDPRDPGEDTENTQSPPDEPETASEENSQQGAENPGGGQSGGLDRNGQDAGNAAADSGIAVWGPKAAAALGWAVLAALLVWLIRSLCRRRKQRYHEKLKRDLRQRRNRRLVLGINRRVYRRLCRKKCRPGRKLSDAEYEKELKESYPHISGEEWNFFMRVMKKAYFSLNDITDEEAAGIYRLYCENSIKKK